MTTATLTGAEAQERVNAMTGDPETIAQAIRDLAAAQVAQYPQYAGHFDEYQLVTIRERVTGKGGLYWEAGDVALAVPRRGVFDRGWTAWCLRTGWDVRVGYMVRTGR